jgi:hypothetical protein
MNNFSEIMAHMYLMKLILYLVRIKLKMRIVILIVWNLNSNQFNRIAGARKGFHTFGFVKGYSAYM